MEKRQNEKENEQKMNEEKMNEESNNIEMKVEEIIGKNNNYHDINIRFVKEKDTTESITPAKQYLLSNSKGNTIEVYQPN